MRLALAAGGKCREGLQNLHMLGKSKFSATLKAQAKGVVLLVIWQMCKVLRRTLHFAVGSRLCFIVQVNGNGALSGCGK